MATTRHLTTFYTCHGCKSSSDGSPARTSRALVRSMLQQLFISDQLFNALDVARRNQSRPPQAALAARRLMFSLVVRERMRALQLARRRPLDALFETAVRLHLHLRHIVSVLQY